MALVSVRFKIFDTEVPVGVISGTTVMVYDAAGAFVSSGISGIDGIIDILLNGDAVGVPYVVRTYKATVSFVDTPANISVLDPPPIEGNDFKIFGDVNTSLPSDARLCRASGYLRDGKGDPYTGSIRLHCLSPQIVDNTGITGTDVTIEADSNGLFTADLFRTGKYTVVASGIGHDPRLVTVPDQATIPIIDLLFPIIISITYTPVAPFNMSVGDVLEITPVVQATDGRTLTGAALNDLIWSVDDTSVASLITSADKLTIKAIKIGNTSLRATRKQTNISRIPDTLTGETAAIVVT